MDNSPENNEVKEELDLEKFAEFMKKGGKFKRKEEIDLEKFQTYLNNGGKNNGCDD